MNSNDTWAVGPKYYILYDNIYNIYVCVFIDRKDWVFGKALM